MITLPEGAGRLLRAMLGRAIVDLTYQATGLVGTWNLLSRGRGPGEMRPNPLDDPQV
jgi:hypothetical protein